MSLGAQNRSEDAKTPSAGRAMSKKPEPDPCPIQPYPNTAPPLGPFGKLILCIAVCRRKSKQLPSAADTQHPRGFCLGLLFRQATPRHEHAPIGEFAVTNYSERSAGPRGLVCGPAKCAHDRSSNEKRNTATTHK